MANLTLSIDDKLLKRARMRALELDTTVNALVRDYIEGLAGENPTRRALDDFLEMTENISASSGSEGRGWTREEIYDR